MMIRERDNTAFVIWESGPKPDRTQSRKMSWEEEKE